MTRHAPKPRGDAETHQNEVRSRAGPFCALRVVFNTFLHTPGTKRHTHERLARRKFVKIHTKKRLKAERGANTFSKRLAVLSPRPASRRRTTGDAKDKKGDKGIAKTAHALQTHLQNALMREHRHPFERSGHRCLESRPEHAPAPKLLETRSRTRMHFSARSVIQLSPTCVCTLGPNGGSEFADAINFVLNFNTNQASRPEM